MILFHKVLAPYRKIELLDYLLFSFGIMQNFRSISRPFRTTVENSYLNKFDVELSQLSKNVRDLKIGHILASWSSLAQ